ncbi:hypothetical protein HWV62_37685 [Athelia sp. TMB]|nr:hypothetical protein HWV62_37685 [Athelia sp. TMB]
MRTITFNMSSQALSNGIAPSTLELPYPDRPEIITANLLKLNNEISDLRVSLIFKSLITHLHQFISETSITTEEWMKTIEYLTRVGQTCTPLRQEFILLSDILGASALVDALNNPPISGATDSSVLGPFFTDDAPDLAAGESIASEGSGEYLYVEGHVRSIMGEVIPNALIDTWETDSHGNYDTQRADRDGPDCRGRLRTDKDGKYSFKAVVPVAYPIPGDGPVGDLLKVMGRHNMRPNHLHLKVQAPGYHTLVTALYPEGDSYLASDPVFGVKKSLVVKYEDINDKEKAKKHGFLRGGSFKVLKFDLILVTEVAHEAARAQMMKKVD